MIAIRCQMLNGTYQAAAASPGGTAAEWPPAPARVHAALLAAAIAASEDGCCPPDALAVLEALERAPAPALHLPVDASLRDAPIVYVPVKPGRQDLRLAPRRFPTIVLGDEPVWFIWREVPDVDRTVLERLVRDVQWLGSSRSPVCCDVVERDVPAPNLIPTDAPAAEDVRVAHPGFTRQLQDVLAAEAAADSGRPAPAWGRRAGYIPRDAEGARVAMSPYGRLLVRAFGLRAPLGTADAHRAVRAFRKAVLSHAGASAPALLHGHGDLKPAVGVLQNPHVAFLALGNVGHEHADGRLLGMAAAIPTTASADERGFIERSVAKVSHICLPRIGKVEMPFEIGREPWTLNPRRWAGPAYRWQTVTPVSLTAQPKSTSEQAKTQAVEKTLAIAVQAGFLPATPEHVEFSPVPWLRGAQPVAAHFRSGFPRGFATHMQLTFSAPVCGPLVAGRGRQLGAGMFAPIPDSEDDRG